VAFRKLKDQLEVGSIYHWTGPRVRVHVAICFLALLLEVRLRRRLARLGVEASYREVLRDVRQVKAVKLRVKEIRRTGCAQSLSARHTRRSGRQGCRSQAGRPIEGRRYEFVCLKTSVMQIQRQISIYNCQT